MVNVSQINNTNSSKLSASSNHQQSSTRTTFKDTKTINDINTHENMISSSSSTGSNNGEYVESSNNIIAATRTTTTTNLLINKKKSHLNGQKSNTNGISSSITSSSSNYSSNASSPSSSQISFAINQLVISNSIGEESQPLKTPIKTNGISFHYELNSLNLQSYTSHNNSMSYKTLLRVKKVLLEKFEISTLNSNIEVLLYVILIIMFVFEGRFCLVGP